ncbi:MAG: hypothetical protein LBP40_00875 [Campylobacteraceae bacterium]|jgi:hypothetical protein|nr:hypothetical protein [Campylobacteraceae bacterium]
MTGKRAEQIENDGKDVFVRTENKIRGGFVCCLITGMAEDIKLGCKLKLL